MFMNDRKGRNGHVPGIVGVNLYSVDSLSVPNGHVLGNAKRLLYGIIGKIRWPYPILCVV